MHVGNNSRSGPFGPAWMQVLAQPSLRLSMYASYGFQAHFQVRSVVPYGYCIQAHLRIRSQGSTGGLEPIPNTDTRARSYICLQFTR